jgi:hypothetical protein
MPAALRWPSSGKTIAWDRLREITPALHGFARALDDGCAAAEADPTLSPEGIRRRRAALGVAALKELAQYAPLVKAEAAVKRDLETITSKMTDMPPPPTTVAEASDGVELRAFIRAQKSPIDFVIAHLADRRVLGAVLHGALPALAGLSEAEFNVVQDKARRAHHPLQAEAIAQLSKAAADAIEGVAAARRLVCERCEVIIGDDGEARSIHDPSHARLTVVPIAG